MTVAHLVTETVFDIDALLSPEEIEWKLRARKFARDRILPTIEQDFEDKHFRTEFVGGSAVSGYSACT